MIFFNSIQSEWLKTKRSASFWLSVVGGFFIPLIFLIGFIYNHSSINSYGDKMNIWVIHFNRCWMQMSAFLLPMGVILASSLITQLEYRNNTWKQLHTTPQSYTMIFFSKLTVILFMTLQFFIFFNIGILISGILPSLLFDGSFPNQSIPVLYFIKWNLKFFIACLPIISIQYLISLRFNNFLVPIGIGLVALIGTLIASSWKYIFLSPFSFGILITNTSRSNSTYLSIYLIALISFVTISIANYLMYIYRKEKG